MKYIANEKLKLDRELVQFVSIGQYFESPTFDFLKLSRVGNSYSVKLVQALNYMYSFSPSMDEFETVEELEGVCESSFSGTLDNCLEWANSTYGCSKEKWSHDIISIYNNYVNNQELGQGCDHL